MPLEVVVASIARAPVRDASPGGAYLRAMLEPTPPRPALAALCLTATLGRSAPLRAAPPEPDTVLVPAGETVQGQAGLPDAPPRTVRLSAFRVHRTEVSVARYEDFVAQGGYGTPELWSEGGRAWLEAHPEGAGAAARRAGRDTDHPVLAVTFWEAEAYCAWAGGALPTEAQWERAACGDGERRFPWGDGEEGVTVAWYAGGKYGHLTEPRTEPVGQADPSASGPYGALHMVGNVWEWTRDTYHREAWAEGEAATDPVGTRETPWRTLRGGSYMNLPSYSTCAHREPARPDRVAFTTGFRCVFPAP